MNRSFAHKMFSLICICIVVVFVCSVNVIATSDELFNSQNQDIVLENDSIPPTEELPVQEKILIYANDYYLEKISGIDKTQLDLPLVTEIMIDDGEVYQIIEDAPVKWDLTNIPETLSGGMYTISGAISEDFLLEYNIMNSKNIQPKIEITTVDSGPIKDLTAGIKEVKDKQVVAFNIIPTITGVTAIYAEYSYDGMVWERVKVNISSPNEEEIYSENLLEQWGGVFVPEDHLLIVRYSTNPSFYARLTIVGSIFEGTTNVIQFGVPTVPDQDTDESGGDKGGGGQGEHDRPGKDEDTDTEDKNDPDDNNDQDSTIEPDIDNSNNSTENNEDDNSIVPDNTSKPDLDNPDNTTENDEDNKLPEVDKPLDMGDTSKPSLDQENIIEQDGVDDHLDNSSSENQYNEYVPLSENVDVNVDKVVPSKKQSINITNSTKEKKYKYAVINTVGANATTTDSTFNINVNIPGFILAIFATAILLVIGFIIGKKINK